MVNVFFYDGKDVKYDYNICLYCKNIICMECYDKLDRISQRDRRIPCPICRRTIPALIFEQSEVQLLDISSNECVDIDKLDVEDKLKDGIKIFRNVQDPEWRKTVVTKIYRYLQCELANKYIILRSDK